MTRAIGAVLTAAVATTVEAWQELRIHRLRVLLALIGVAVAVAAITGVTAGVQMLNQAYAEQSEHFNGRSTLLDFSAYPTNGTSSGVGAARPASEGTPDPTSAAYARVVERYQIRYASRYAYVPLSVRLPGGVVDVQAQAVDPDYGVLYRMDPEEGRWFADSDRRSLAPVLVVNRALLDTMGVEDLTNHPTVLLEGDGAVTASIAGVLSDDRLGGSSPAAFVLYDHAVRWGLAARSGGLQGSELRVWVPPDQADALRDAISRDLTASLEGMSLGAWDNTSTATAIGDAQRWIVLGIGGFVLLLGGLGLVNISMVTVRYRIREIGIRRSFGATSGRVFSGVLMESVVATVAAGVLGVGVAIAGLSWVPWDRLFGSRVQDLPPFPAGAALFGLACAAGIGALAGILPALTAVRVKVIDAIRY